MAWIDRVVEYPNRVTLTPVSGQDNTYNIEANEGTVYVEGTLLNAENLNNETMNLISEVVADGWSSSKSYSIGDSCIYNNMLWNCLTANTNTQPTEGTYWTRTKLAMADYVIEQGTKSNWDYQKWASGKFECWTRRTTSRTVQHQNFKVPFPITLIGNPIINANGGSTGAVTAYVEYVQADMQNNQADIYVNTQNSGATVWVFVHVVGKWK